LDALRASGQLKNNAELQKAVDEIRKDSSGEMLNALSGEVYASTRSALLNNQQMCGHVQARALNLGAERLAYNAEQRYPVMMASNGNVGHGSSLMNPPLQRFWVNTWGYEGHTAAKRNTARTDHSGHGVALGADAHLTDNFSAGLFFSYEDSQIKNGGLRHSRTDVASYSVGSYFSSSIDAIELQGGLAYSHLDLDSRRNMAALGLGTAKANYDARKVQAFGEAGYALLFTDALSLTPYLGIAQTWLHTDKAKERGSAGALDIKASNDSVLQSTLGQRVAYRLPTANPTRLTTNLGWVHSFGDAKSKASNNFAGTTTGSFAVEGTGMDKNRGLVGVGIETRLAPNASLSLGYEGEFGSHYKNNTGSVQFTLSF